MLPAAALGAMGGGRIAVAGDDPQGLTAGEGVFIVNLEMPDGTPPVARGTRVFVRFVHASEPLASQATRAAETYRARFVIGLDNARAGVDFSNAGF